MRVLPRRSNDRAEVAARASVRRAHGTAGTDDGPTKGMPTDATIAPASRATDGTPMQGILTDGILKVGLATARRPRRVLAAAGLAVSRILRQTSGQNSVLRIAQASLMGYK